MRVVEIEAEPLVERLMIAETLWAQIRGLLGRPPLRPGEGFLIRHCNSVHSFGMRYPFLAVHLDKDYVVLKTVLMGAGHEPGLTATGTAMRPAPNWCAANVSSRLTSLRYLEACRYSGPPGGSGDTPAISRVSIDVINQTPFCKR